MTLYRRVQSHGAPGLWIDERGLPGGNWISAGVLGDAKTSRLRMNVGYSAAFAQAESTVSVQERQRICGQDFGIRPEWL